LCKGQYKISNKEAVMTEIPPVFPPSKVNKVQISDKDRHDERNKKKKKDDKKDEDDPQDKIEISSETSIKKESQKIPSNPLEGHIDIDV
jgi:hypothetical protein